MKQKGDHSDISQNLNKSSKNKKSNDKTKNVNVYEELAKLEPEDADRITNAKTNGGRSLDAIWANKRLSTTEKMILLCLGHHLNYTKNFANQYRYISLNKIAEETSLTRRSVIQILNGYKSRGKTIPGLIERGYINKMLVTPKEQELGWSNHYCITPQIFDEYMLTLIEKEKTPKCEKKHKPKGKTKLELVKLFHPPSETVSPPLVKLFHPPSETVSPKVPRMNIPKIKFLPDADRACARVEGASASGEVKGIQKKSELVEMAKDLHRLSVEQRMAPRVSFSTFDEHLNPFFRDVSLPEIHKFYVYALEQGIGVDVRKSIQTYLAFKSYYDKPETYAEDSFLGP